MKVENQSKFEYTFKNTLKIKNSAIQKRNCLEFYFGENSDFQGYELKKENFDSVDQNIRNKKEPKFVLSQEKGELNTKKRSFRSKKLHLQAKKLKLEEQSDTIFPQQFHNQKKGKIPFKIFYYLL